MSYASALLSAVLSTVLNLVLLVGIPFGVYVIWHVWRHGRGLGEIAVRAGLRRCEPRYLGYAAVFALATTLIGLVVEGVWKTAHWGSGQGQTYRLVAGIGLVRALPIALLYGVIKTGFCEEVLFRGLIAGSLSRRLAFAWANFWQAVIFVLPHLLVLRVSPGAWKWLPLVFLLGLVLGALRIKSGSILPTWLIHAWGNIVHALKIAVHTS